MAFEDLRASGPRVRSELLVEAKPGADQAVGREIGEFRPGQFNFPAAGKKAKPHVPPPPELLAVGQAQQLDLPDGARREAVSAHLLAGEEGLLDDSCLNACGGQVVGGRGSGRAGADDED